MTASATQLVLWLPQYVLDSQYNRESYLGLREGRVKVFRTQPEVEIGTSPDWSMDPLKDATWRLYYHGLTWLLACAWGIDEGDDLEFAQAYLRDTIRGYLRANVFADPIDDMAWDDHSTADRLAVISLLWHRYLAPAAVMPSEEIGAAAEIHVERLLGFYRSEKWLVSNHGLFHALALLDSSLVFPDTPWARAASSQGKEYLRRTVEEIVDPAEGISTEQSIHYHQFALRSLRAMRPFLAANFPDLNEMVTGVADRMVDFNLCIAGSQGSMPALGDTRVFDRIPEDCLRVIEDETASSHQQYVESKGRTGIPFDNLVVYPSTGLAVFRQSDPTTAPSRAVFAFHPERIAHGHYDALNVVLHLDGRDLLIDSGGPYKYGDFWRFGYFMSSRAHNVLVVDGEDHLSPGTLVDSGGSQGVYWVSAEHEGYPGRTVSRTVVWHPDGTVAIFDGVTSAGFDSAYEILWHLPPGMRTTETDDGQGLTTVFENPDGSAASRTLSTAPLTSQVVEGVTGTRPQGWITESLGEKRPAPVQVISCEADALQVLTVFGQPLNSISAGQSDNGYWVEMGQGRVLVDELHRVEVSRRQ